MAYPQRAALLHQPYVARLCLLRPLLEAGHALHGHLEPRLHALLHARQLHAHLLLERVHPRLPRPLVGYITAVAATGAGIAAAGAGAATGAGAVAATTSGSRSGLGPRATTGRRTTSRIAARSKIAATEDGRYRRRPRPRRWRRASRVGVDKLLWWRHELLLH